MKKIYLPFFCFCLFFATQFFCGITVFAQCKPIIKIDGVQTVIDPTNTFGISFPYWLKAGQTLAVGSNISAISVIEFNVNNTALEFSQVLNITSTTAQTVLSSKVWKIESVVKSYNTSQYTSTKFTVPGNYTFKVPGCEEQICIEVWGAGGGGGGTGSNGPVGGGGGGGGGYGTQCFSVTGNTSLSVSVGLGGVGAASSAGTLGGTSSVSGTNVSISSTGGSGGGLAIGTGGGGGISTATNNSPGQTGQNGSSTVGGAGGAGANGADGGAQQIVSATGNNGSSPGGCGGAAWTTSSTARPGGNAGNGQVLITW